MKILFVSPVPFYGLRQRHQGLAVEFSAAGGEVIFLNPLESPGFSIKVETFSPSLKIVTVAVPFRAAQYPLIQALSNRLALKLIFRQKVVARETALWVGEPSAARMADFEWKVIFYDRCDRHGFFHGQNPKTWQKYEEILFLKAKKIFVSSEFLMQEIPERWKEKSILLPNAADKSWLESPLPSKPSFPPLKLLSAGAHYEWTDFAWLQRFAKRSDIELHIAGKGRGKAFKNLIGMSGVCWHGFLSLAELRNLADQCHVGLIPFNDSEITAGIDPIKNYEYAARGLEVWGTPIPSLRRNPLVGKIIGDFRDIEDAIAAFGKFPKTNSVIPTWTERATTVFRLCPFFEGR